jgi:very-short-patch-repair endonuclease
VRAAAAALDLARLEVESPMETRLRLAIVFGGLPEPVVQYAVRTPQGRFVARLDLAYPEKRVGLEYDGDHHRDRETFRADAVRLNRLRLLDWSVLRFTADDVLRNPDRMLAQIRAALNL